MVINLEELNANIKDEIIVQEDINFKEEYFLESGIKELTEVSLDAIIRRNSSDELMLHGNISGKMKIEDSISLEEVIYPFDSEIEENLEELIIKNKNSIDIMDILWQNIVLEIPIKYTEVEDLSQYSGNGWKLISEDEVTKDDNPFNILMENIKEE